MPWAALSVLDNSVHLALLHQFLELAYFQPCQPLPTRWTLLHSLSSDKHDLGETLQSGNADIGGTKAV